MAKNQKLSTSEFRQQILDPDRVIFLDIDGVLNSGFWNQRHQKEIRRTKKFSLVKADEILLWLKFHGSVSGWAVLEDLDLHREEFEGHQVKTDPWVGLTRKDIAQAEKILNAHMGRAHAPKA